MGLTLTNCDSFLDYNPTAVIDEDKAFSDPDAMVTAAYAMLGDCWYTYPFNLWPYGDLTSAAGVQETPTTITWKSGPR